MRVIQKCVLWTKLDIYVFYSHCLLNFGSQGFRNHRPWGPYLNLYITVMVHAIFDIFCIAVYISIFRTHGLDCIAGSRFQYKGTYRRDVPFEWVDFFSFLKYDWFITFPLLYIIRLVGFMVFNTTFNTISVILWR
jgi:hypothetical protein